MAKGDDLEERLTEFAERIVKLCDAMPKTPAGRHLSNQLVRSGTSPAFNYWRSRENHLDFSRGRSANIFCLPELNPASPWRNPIAPIVAREVYAWVSHGEARAAESKRDFIHKMRIVHKELNESNINLKVIHRSQLLPEKLLSSIMDECDQLCRIFNASIQTALDKT